MRYIRINLAGGSPLTHLEIALTALISLDSHGHLSIPHLAARYSFERRDTTDSAWRTMDRYTMPDGTLAGASVELVGAVLLHQKDSMATLLENGLLTLFADNVSFRFTPVADWKRLTPAHAFAARYSVETTHAGRGSWTMRGALKDTASASEVRTLANDVLRVGSEVSVHTTGVLIVETRAEATALRLTPLAAPDPIAAGKAHSG
ncbi:hypothetical protein [Streptomyces mutabilis]|uniref:Uncharacterized protein n=1 Tax=Streptomyces mutabilis TaxID=67332 RepID=A0A086MRJ2_9ACTN|nr:hypothetical protein [Streptomyces mutabilis]KFG71510.1 hypothetical protein FM21_35250 [Streptomyces mutabilis]